MSGSVERLAPGAAGDVTADVNYLLNDSERPFVHMYEPPPGIPARGGTYVPHRVGIRDVRPLAGELNLDEQGFVLRRHDSAVANFYDEGELRSVYYAEIERLVRDITGADSVRMFDHTLRSARARGDGVQQPVRVAHNDYTLKSGPQRVRDLLPPVEASARLRRRFAIVNVWRPIRGPVRDTPLALCDARGIAQRDLVPTEMRYRDRVGETYSLIFNPDHRWFHVPRMQAGEALIFKGFDSADDGRARFTAHTAFDDPTAPSDAAPRESIEARLLVFFE